MTLFTRELNARRGARSSRRGFTLLEIMVVLAIIGLLVSLAISNLGKILGDSNAQIAQIFVKQSLRVPLTSYRMNMGDYPSTSEGLKALVSAPADKAGLWRGPYVEDSKIPLDPWKREYQYRYPGTHNKNSYDVFSLGQDGKESDDDIGNW